MKKYYPILLSKSGELNALALLENAVKMESSPILEVLADSLLDKEGAYSHKLQETLLEIWGFDTNEIFLDFSLFDGLNRQLTQVKKFLTFLLKNNINVVPVVLFNSNSAYLDLVSSLVKVFGCNICIRENNNSGSFIDFNDQILAMLKRLGSTEDKTCLLIDLGFVEKTNDKLLAALAYSTVKSLPTPKAWAQVIIASGSFLKDLGALAGPLTDRSPARVHKHPRLEWKIWSTLKTRTLPTDIKYGDYGTKHPYYVPAAFEGTASIKYTIKEDFIIYRGRKASEHAKGGGQYNDSAKSLIATAEYCGRGFCWADNEIYEIANRTNKPGNAETWVRISQNHHMTFLHSLL